jgi:hypothetical protein
MMLLELAQQCGQLLCCHAGIVPADIIRGNAALREAPPQAAPPAALMHAHRETRAVVTC